jgi:hypothetical protein
LHIVHSQPGVLLGSVYHQVLSLWCCEYLPVTIHTNSTLVSANPTQYPSWCLLVFKPCRRDLIVPSCIHHVLLSREDHLWMRHCLIQHGSSCPMESVTLNLGIWEGLFPFWAFARVVEPRKSNDEVQHKQSCEAPSDLTRCFVVHARKKILHGKSRRSSSRLFWHPLISTTNTSFIISCAPLS